MKKYRCPLRRQAVPLKGLAKQKMIAHCEWLEKRREIIWERLRTSWKTL